jgi:hypothetical protein
MFSELLDKLTSYNLFNYLLPGAVFSYFAQVSFKLQFVPDDLITAAFVYYFLGVVVSRFGSIILEPLLRKFGVVTVEPYTAFLTASEKDAKLETLVEAANMYRTFAAAMLLLLVMSAYFKLESSFPLLLEWRSLIGGVSLVLVFLVAYKKQSDYIISRVRKLNN